jgi:hypothetical protein
MKFILNTPVAFLVFNRPDTTKLVFDEIRRARPNKLLLVADGPRLEIIGEIEKCNAVRDIINSVDWPCEVIKNYSDINLGCKIRVSSGINWVFEQVDEAIILEDDCLPDQSFFSYCATLLEKYKEDERIMQISGCNFQNGIQRGNGSYYFSTYHHIWGWATWKRAWKKYDLEMKAYPDFIKSNQIKNYWNDKRIQKFWTNIFNAAYNGEIDTWDQQWAFTISSQNGLTILPNVNLISNIGFGINATHTKKNSKESNLKSYRLNIVSHPTFVSPDYKADLYTYKQLHDISFSKRIMQSIKYRVNKYLDKL